MPVIKNGFDKAAMNKDFDERIVPSGQYRDAMNIQVSTSEGSNVGTVQNILGNTRVENLIPIGDEMNPLTGQEYRCVGAVVDEKNDALYWFVTCAEFDAIIEYKDDPTNQTSNTCTPILVDRNKDVLKFDYNTLITAVNIIDDMLFWTDNVNEPKKISISTLKNNLHTNLTSHSSMYRRADWGQTTSAMINIGPIKEDHITVIKKKPGKAPTIAFSDSNVQRIYDFGDTPSSAFNLTPIDISIGGSLPLVGTDLTFTHEGYSNYFEDFEYIIGDIILLSRDDTTGNLPQNYELKLKITGILYDNWWEAAGWGRFRFTGEILEISSSIPVDEAFFYNSYKKVDTDVLFEKEFIRFATRYKYADGQYSAFSPFTQPVFLAGSFGFHPTKDPYNLGMENNIIDIRLQDLVTPDIPNDVAQIDILFKKETSTTVYSVDSIRPDDPPLNGSSYNYWNSNSYTSHKYLTTGYVEGTGTEDSTHHATNITSNKGEYIVSTENIYAALPENQILRPWDNVPRQALAQEITSNRIVYANYLQNYTLKDFEDRICYPDLDLGYEERKFDPLNTTAVTFETGKQSVKSDRTYYLGVVYGDRYGRETPVFTGKDSSIKIPYDISDSATFSGAASKSLRLRGSLIGEQPSFAEYYKYFIKQTTGEYYNLTMDRVYKNTGDDTMWISFPSSDRNKLQEGDYLTIKKQVDVERQVPEENKLKVIDIQNNAPDSIKFEYTQLGTGGGTAEDLAALFSNSSAQPAEDVKRISIDRETWIESEFGMDLDKFASTSRHLVIQFEITSNNVVTKSEKYDVAAYFREEAGNDGVYNFLLNKKITPADSWVESSPGVLNSAKLLTIVIFEKTKKNTTEFEGRFFVKIISNTLTNQYLIPSASSTTNDYQVVARAYVFNLFDRHQTHTSLNASTTGYGIYNSTEFNTGNTQPVHVTAVDTKTEPRWAEITKFNSNQTSNQGWFIDNMHFVSGQEPPEMQATLMWDAAQSGRMHKGNPGMASTIDQGVYGMEGIVKAGPGTAYNFNSSGDPNGAKHWSNDKILRLKSDYEAEITANNNPYVGTGTDDVEWTKVYEADNTENPQKVFMHLSYSSVGVDLHDGDFHVLDAFVSMSWNTYTLSMQGGMLGEHAFQWIAAKGIHFDDSISGPHYHHAIGNNITEFNDYMNSSSLEAHDRQFDPSFRGGPSAEAVMNRLVPGSKFQFDGDDDNTYTILSSDVKYLYNHTPWNPVLKTDNNGDVQKGGNSVSEALQEWYDSGFSTTKYEDFKEKVVDFGRANNRRVVFILQLSRDGAQSSIPGDSDPRQQAYNPMDTADVDDYQTIRFLDYHVEPGTSILPTSPAIFETEGTENIDLNIYYEASDALPLRLDLTDGSGTTGLESNGILADNGVKYEKDSVKGYLLAPVGSRVTINNPPSFPGEIDYGPQAQQFPEEDFFVRVVDWDGNILSIAGPGLQATDTIANGGLTSSSNQYAGLTLTFWRDDLSYTKATVYAIREIVDNSNGSAAYITKIEIDPMVYQIGVGLPYYNCFSFGNGVESNRIRDDFNASFIQNGVKASTVLEEPYEEERRKYGLIYSGLYNSTSGVNNLNQFIQAEQITKELMPAYGSIQKLYARDNDLVTFCEDRVLQIFVDKDVLYNADGKPHLLATNRVLGEARPFSGDYGISRNPESFAKESFRAYFTDKQRGAVLRLSKDGLTPISNQGLHDYFRDNLRDGGKIYGSYDLHKKDYNLSIFYADGENLILNPGFEEGGNFLTTLAPELLLNPGFDNATNVLGSELLLQPELPVTLAGQTNFIDDFDCDAVDTSYNHYGSDVTTTVSQTVPVTPYGNYSGQTMRVNDTTGLFHNMNVKYVSNVGSFGMVVNSWSTTTHDEIKIANVNHSTGFITLQTTNPAGGIAAVVGAGGIHHGATIVFEDYPSHLPITVNTWNITNYWTTGVYFTDLSTWWNGDPTAGSTNTQPWNTTSSRAIAFETSNWMCPNGANIDYTQPSSNLLDIQSSKSYDLSFNVSTFRDAGGGYLHDPEFEIAIYGSMINGVATAVKFNVVLNSDYAWDQNESPPGDSQVSNYWFGTSTSSATGDSVNGTTDTYLANRMVIKLVSGGEGQGAGLNQSFPVMDGFSLVESGYVLPTNWMVGPGMSGVDNIIPTATNSASLNDGSGSVLFTSPNEMWPSEADYLQQHVATANQPGDYDHVQVSFEVFNLTHHIGSGPGGGGSRGLRVSFYNDNLKGFKTSPHEITLTPGSNTVTINKNMAIAGTNDPNLAGLIRFETTGRDIQWDGVSFNIDNLSMKIITQNTPNWALTGYNNNGVVDSSPAIQGDFVGITVPSGAPVIPLDQGWYRVTSEIASVSTPGKLRTVIGPNVAWIDDSPPEVNVSNQTHFIQTSGTYETNIYIADTDDYPFFFGNIGVGGAHANGVFGVDSISLRQIVPWGGTVPEWDIDTTGLAAGQIFYDEIKWERKRVVTFREAIAGVHLKQYFSNNLFRSENLTLENAEFHFEMGDKYRTTFKMKNVDFGNSCTCSVDPTVNTTEALCLSVTGAQWTCPAGVCSIDPTTNTSEALCDAATGVWTPSLFPKLTMMVYNEVGEGFRETVDLQEGNKTYEFVNEIGEHEGNPATNQNPLPIDLLRRMSFYIGEWNDPETMDSWVGDDLFYGNIDDISIEKIGGGKTITFSEDVRGWTSFKSFIPEFGISVVNQYYTMKYGKLYKHHIPGTDRNTFYGEFEESSITPILNTHPDVIKNFNTLFYEGSQSRIRAWTASNTDGEYYNLYNDEGWYVENIHTDKQRGSVGEFIEKEGKWFNAIRGRVGQVDTAAFNFQGIGTTLGQIITGCTNDAPGDNPDINGFGSDGNICVAPCAFGYAAANYNPNATVDDGSCNLIFFGCMDPNATNYNPVNSVDDGSCIFLNGFEAQFRHATAAHNDGAMRIVHAGTNIPANYYGSTNNPHAYIPNFGVDGIDLIWSSYGNVTNPGTYPFSEVTGLNLGPVAVTVNSNNTYNPSVNFNAFILGMVVNGCTDPTATNFDYSANTDDGSCTY